MMHQFSFFSKERTSFRRSRNRTSKPRAQTAPAESNTSDSKDSNDGLTGTVGPGILARFRRLFNSIRRGEERREIFQYTPSQNPEEFLENLRQNAGMGGEGIDRLASCDAVIVSPDSEILEGHTRFVCISDTHSTHRRMKVPEGDVLIHCGDFTERGFMKEVLDFNDWLGKLPHKHKIVIAGNHEISFDKAIMEGLKNSENVRFRMHKNIPETIWRDWQSVMTNCTYLEDSETEVQGIRIYGSPWQPNCGNLAFNLKRGHEILEKWKKIPDGIDILLTHGPPAGRLDCANRGTRAGCVDLLNEVQLRVRPRYHVFGHIHDGYGTDSDGQTTYINCSVVDAFRNPVHHAVVFDYPNKLISQDSSVPKVLVTPADMVLGNVQTGNASEAFAIGASGSKSDAIPEVVVTSVETVPQNVEEDSSEVLTIGVSSQKNIVLPAVIVTSAETVQEIIETHASEALLVDEVSKTVVNYEKQEKDSSLHEGAAQREEIIEEYSSSHNESAASNDLESTTVEKECHDDTARDQTTGHIAESDIVIR